MESEIQTQFNTLCEQVYTIVDRVERRKFYLKMRDLLRRHDFLSVV